MPLRTKKVGMVLYTCASCMLGWASIPHLARHSLAQRSHNLHITRALSIIAALYCSACALSSWLLLPGHASLALSLGGACMAALLICDIRARILPTELVVLLLIFAVAFRLATGSVSELSVVFGGALVAAGFCMLLNALHRTFGKADAIGMGDVRCLLPLCVFSGMQGVLYGMMACALVMGVFALVHLIVRRGDSSGHLPMAPGLAAWLIVGTLAPFVI